MMTASRKEAASSRRGKAEFSSASYEVRRTRSVSSEAAGVADTTACNHSAAGTLLSGLSRIRVGWGSPGL